MKYRRQTVIVDYKMMHRILFGPYDAEITQELPIEEVKRRYPDAKIPGETE